MAVRDLIFDLGMFDGDDTAFYLGKGFRVVAVEARPDLCAAARVRFAGAIASGQLTIVERAIWTGEGERIAFYIRSGWSSAFRESVERDGKPSDEPIEVETTTTAALLARFGAPHFLKCDIEGAEDIVIDGLAQAGAMPAFVSMEDPTGQTARRLLKLGYDRFQMLNQGYLRLLAPPSPPREGSYFYDEAFTGRSSGVFGFELPPALWTDEPTLQARLRLWHALRNKTVNPAFGYLCKRWGKLTGRGWLIPGGWSDIHATTAATLSRQ